MEDTETLPSVEVSEDGNSQSSLSEVAVEKVSSSTGQSYTCNDTNENNEKHSDVSSPFSMLHLVTPVKFSLDESHNRSPDMSVIPSGFDSADSTNDADFLTTQKAVLSAIDLMDEGEEEDLVESNKDGKSRNDILASKDECKTVTGTSCLEKPESNLDEDKINIEATTVREISNSSSTQVQSKTICEYSTNVDSIKKKIMPEAYFENTSNKVEVLNKDAKENTTFDVNIEHNISENSITTEKNNEVSNESHNVCNNINIDIEDNSIKKVNENLSNSGNVDLCCEDDEFKSAGMFSIENTSKSNNKTDDLEISSLTSKETSEIPQNSGRTCSEDSSKAHTSGSKIVDADQEFEQFPSTSNLVTRNKNKLDVSDKAIMPGKIPSSPDTQVEKMETEPTLPSVEISDVEVSVFKYERKKKGRPKSKNVEQFKLDDMVLSSEEDSEEDISEYIKRKSPNVSSTSKVVLNITSNLSDIAETNSAHKIAEVANDIDSEETKKEEATKEPQSPLDNNSEIEVMEVEDSRTIQEDCNSKNQEEITDCNGKNPEETTNMDVEESDDSIEMKETSSELSSSECLTNKTLKQGSFISGDSEIANSPCNSNATKDDSETEPDNSESVLIKDSESDSEIASKHTDSNEVNSENKETDLEDMLRAALAKNEKFRENLSQESSKGKNNSSSENTVPKDAEVICLVDDDDDDDVNEKKKPPAAVNCVNPNCMSGEDLAPPAMFVLSYFGMKRSKGQQVCAECFDKVVEHQEVLCSLLQQRKPMLSANFPSHKDVILLDSDEESLSDNESNLSEDTMSMIRENLDDVITETLAKYDFDFQLRESCSILNQRLTKLEEEAQDITSRYDSVQHSLDEFRKRIYEQFQQEAREKEEVHFMECEIPPMPIIKSKLQNQLYNRELMNRFRKSQQEKEGKEAENQQLAGPTRTIATKKVSHVSQSQTLGDNTTQEVTFVRSEAKCEPPPNLPPPGPLVRPKLRVGDLAYTMKVSYFSIWVHCRIIEVIPRNPTENDPSTETYRVKLENVKKNAVRTVTGKYLAYPTPARVQLRVGIRVIAIFKEEDDSAVVKDNYYVGVVAEPPKSTNKYRYLVFFDDGYTQYCPHENILVVCATSKNVWEDIHPEPRDFIKNYLQQYPERPMVKLSRGQIVKVEWNGRWWIVRVLEVDGSLVKVHFDADKRTEWIYRGSTRLGPMYQELAAAKERQHGSLLRSRGFGGGAHHKSDMPYVEYTRGDGEGDSENRPELEEKDKAGEPAVTIEEQAPAPRSVARKSTAKKAPEPVISNAPYSRPLVSHPPEGRLRQRKLKPKCRPLKFRPHTCSDACSAWTSYTPAAANKYDPLIRPLMYGFERLLGSFKGKTIVQYRTPCGRMIRTHQEMLCYLRSSRSQLTIDLFDFDFWVNPLNEFEEGSTFGKIEDLSYGKENVRISCVNELDHSMPQYVQYMTARQPAKDVNLNLDPEFLVGCDCTDDCADRAKCSCWQLTMQGKAYVPDGDLDPLFGYQYRRLPERIATGIYECNSRCKCSMTCQNRVAQQPLSCRLQLFKTLKKGWGIRCLHDIPRGAFICIYAGFLLTELEANEGGKTYGDEYLAELDYIESVENLKEGYESEAKDPSDLEDDDDDGSQKDTMDIEYEHSADSDGDQEQGYSRRPGDIRLRLRRRTADEAEKESRKSKPEDDTISISDDELDSGNCGGCRESLENVKDTLRCQGCVKSYHFKCTPLKTSANVDKLGSNKSSWICPKCVALVRKPKTFDANITVNENEDAESRYPSVRELYGPDENVYIMDAKTHGNIGRYLNHSCSPNVFVQNVFVDTHDLRFPWVAFFANQYISAGTELTWDYNYDVGSVPGKVMLCYCGSNHCRGRLL